MAAYNPKKRRATKKRPKRRRALPATVEGRRNRVRVKRTHPKKVATKKRAAAPKKSTTKKRTAALKKATTKKRTATPKKVATKKRAAAPKKIAAKKRAAAPKKVAAKKRRAAAPKKVAAKKRAAAPKKIVAKKRRVAPKKVAAKKRIRKTKTQLTRELRKTQAQLQKLIDAEQKARGTPKRSPVRVDIRKRKKEIAAQRAQRALVTQDLPRKTPAEKKESSEDNFTRMRRRFRELYEHGERTGQLPPAARLPRRVDSKQLVGEQRQVRVQRIVTTRSVEEIMYKVNQVGRSMSGRFSLWHAGVVLSGLGDKILGSGGRLLQKSGDPDAPNFQVQAFDSSGVWKSYEGMRQALETLLEGFANIPHMVVFLHNVKIMNFDRKRG